MVPYPCIVEPMGVAYPCIVRPMVYPYIVKSPFVIIRAVYVLFLLWDGVGYSYESDINGETDIMYVHRSMPLFES